MRPLIVDGTAYVPADRPEGPPGKVFPLVDVEDIPA